MNIIGDVSSEGSSSERLQSPLAVHQHFIFDFVLPTQHHNVSDVSICWENGASRGHIRLAHLMQFNLVISISIIDIALKIVPKKPLDVDKLVQRFSLLIVSACYLESCE